ncbi:MAG: hypothetical protein IT454_01410 [Planctomycetes bacterium]|nr:hypothetical protein [Planctomycetota bacterium]
MSSLAILGSLPAHFSVTESSVGVLVVRSSLARELAEFGFDLESDGRTRAVALSGRRPMRLLSLAGRDYVVRRFTHGGLLRWLTRERFLDAERPFRELAMSETLLQRGIATPAVLAARARRIPGGGWGLDLITERIVGSVDGGELLARWKARSVPPRHRRTLLSQLGRFVARVHEVGFLHADLHPKNVLLDEAALERGELSAWLIDLDRSVWRERLSDLERQSNLRRMWRYVARRVERGEYDVTVRDALRFLHGYEPRTSQRKLLARAIARGHARGAALHRLGWSLEAKGASRSPGKPAN